MCEITITKQKKSNCFLWNYAFRNANAHVLLGERDLGYVVFTFFSRIIIVQYNQAGLSVSLDLFQHSHG